MLRKKKKLTIQKNFSMPTYRVSDLYRFPSLHNNNKWWQSKQDLPEIYSGLECKPERTAHVLLSLSDKQKCVHSIKMTSNFKLLVVFSLGRYLSPENLMCPLLLRLPFMFYWQSWLKRCEILWTDLNFSPRLAAEEEGHLSGQRSER